MKGNGQNLFRPSLWVAVVCLLVVCAVSAQQPSPSPSPKKSDDSSAGAPVQAGEDAGTYSIITSFEVGYRGLRVVGDQNKYESDLNYRAGPRLFDSSFLMRSREGNGGLFDQLLFTTSGWGGDPSGTMRVSVEKPKWYRFEGIYRRFKYFRFLNTFANPNWVFSPSSFSVPPKPLTGERGFNTQTKLGDFDLTLLPKNRLIRFNVGYSPERYSGPAFTNYHIGGNDFNYPLNLRSQANDFRFGADGLLGPIDYSFSQGFRRFRDDTFTDLGNTPGINLDPTKGQLTSFHHHEPARGSIDFTRLSLHSLVAKRLDITGRIVYSKADTTFTFLQNYSGTNWNPRVSGWPPGPLPSTPNTLNLGQYNITGDTSRPNTLGDIGVTFLATNKLRISNTWRVEDFKIHGNAVMATFFSLTRPSGATTVTDTISFSNLDAHTNTSYRKYQDIVEGDYQFNKNYGVHFGYRYGSRRVEESFEGFNLGSNGSIPPPTRSSSFDSDQNHTHAFFGGFKARPANNLTIYGDAEHGTADNVFTRIGNYNYTNIRAKGRYAPTKNFSFNVSVITRDNANPSEIAGISLEDFGVSVKSRIFTSAVDWTPNSRISFNTGYNYNWINSSAVINYFFNNINHPTGRALYFVRNNFFFIDTTAQLAPRVTLFTSYRINRDTGQGNRVPDPLGNPGFLVSSYPFSFQSPEGRLAIKINRRLDWNVGYQYYNYNESQVAGPRPQNYHAHLPYTSLRFYFGRKD
ncbi:MAG TPA: hypothetical protein VKB46_09575 [Pyrinomonadaceae bacterium]|nr:hypothetical protein [Pyrinomonadaceae bacterium]